MPFSEDPLFSCLRQGEQDCEYRVAFIMPMLRGWGTGQRIFFRGEDCEHFSSLVGEGVERFGHRIHAYCWMYNHVQFAVQAADVLLSRIMQNIAFRYTRWINRREGRVGHLFQGRYKAILVNADSYLLELARYLHLNPVRAGWWTNPTAILGADTEAT